MEAVNLKKGYYYEIFPRKNFNGKYHTIEYLGDNKIKYLDNGEEQQLDKSNTAFANASNNGKEIIYEKNYFGFREISIMPIHLERLGFKKDVGNLYKHSYDLNIYLYLSIILNENHKDIIGTILLNKEESQKLNNTLIDKSGIEKQKYSQKLDIINNLYLQSIAEDSSPYETYKKIMETCTKTLIEENNIIAYTIIEKGFKPIKTINQLFERLEEEGIKIESKEEILK